ncbi:hypothetical protein F5X98DRAFT_328799 [Xylaria grammica]|nr:hypothetical protein F5X98DRAFT_328799 [Xylaria grammica]
MHTDFTASSRIVDNDRIVEIIDREIAGAFGWSTAAKVPRRPSSAYNNISRRANQEAMRLPLPRAYSNDIYTSL